MKTPKICKIGLGEVYFSGLLPSEDKIMPVSDLCILLSVSSRVCGLNLCVWQTKVCFEPPMWHFHTSTVEKKNCIWILKCFCFCFFGFFFSFTFLPGPTFMCQFWVMVNTQGSGKSKQTFTLEVLNLTYFHIQEIFDYLCHIQIHNKEIYRWGREEIIFLGENRARHITFLFYFFFVGVYCLIMKQVL